MRVLSKSHVVFYLAWLAAFAIVEIPAATDSARGDTFSEMIWAFMELSNLSWFVVSGFSLWLFLHFALNRFTRKDE